MLATAFSSAATIFLLCCWLKLNVDCQGFCSAFLEDSAEDTPSRPLIRYKVIHLPLTIKMASSINFRVAVAMILTFRLIWLATAAELITAWGWNNDSQPISIFRSRPDLQAPILRPLEGLHKPDKMAPGYFFVAPYTNMQQGVYIYDNNADLVWTSFGSAGAGIAHAPRVCDYKGEKHLCFYQGVQHVGWGHGHGLILDKHYRVVKSIEPSGTYQTSSDMHEFFLIEDGTRALMTQYIRSVHDLCPWGSCDGLGYIQSGLFQEVDVESGEAVFTWNSLDHVPPTESRVLPSTTEISGDGESPETPWDYFHINSVDKSNFDGNYLISARHTCAVYKISAETGEILWRLGGTNSDYEIGEGVDFAFQHDARWLESSEDASVISIFDNGGNGYSQPEPYSRGIIVRLDHKTKKATLVSSLNPPFVDGHAHISKSQGNYQTGLSNGGSLMGWGNDPYFSEYAEDGEIVFYGALAYGYMMNYRVFKFNGWVGEPLSKPAIWAFSQYGWSNGKEKDNGNTMILYASWNGHTGIKAWTFYGSDEKTGPWETLVGEFKKEGFETIYKHERTYKYTYAEAIGSDGKSLGQTLVQQTFVPNVLMRERYCDELACYFMDTNNPDREAQREKMKELWEAKIKNDQNSTGLSVEDLYQSVYESVSESAPQEELPTTTKSSRVSMFAVSFAVLGLFVIGMFGIALKRYESVQAGWDRLVILLGLKTRRWQEARKGKYFGVDSDESDDGEEGYAETRRARDNRPLPRKETELELERQAFWNSSE